MGLWKKIDLMATRKHRQTERERKGQGKFFTGMPH
jgi:hypothetical protein